MTGAAAGEPRRPAAHRWGVDAAAAAVATFVLLVSAGHLPAGADRRPVDALGYLLLAAAGLALAWCRRHPRAVLAILVAVLGCYVARRYPHGPVLVTGWLALLALSRRDGRRAALVGAVVLCAVLGIAGAVGVTTPLPLIYLGWSAAAVFLGDALRNRRSYLAELEARASYLERTREEEARRLLAEERLRIARDLHDSVAHAMATINVQAAAAGHVVDRRPEAAKDALAAIQRASGDVLDELGAMLRLLRADDESAARAPTPGLDGIAQLVAATGGGGVTVALDVSGPVDEVARPVGAAAYRIVQESLTNVLRHAGATAAQVRISAGADRSLVVEVRDDGVGDQPGSAGTGTGLAGMRERAASTGGRLVAGPASGGGFAVRASWDGRS